MMNLSCNNNPTVAFCTLGCKVNQYETQAIAEDFERLGFVLCDFLEKCDVYIINTCTVTAESDKKSRQMIRKARKIGGDSAIIIACGCYTQAQSENLLKITELNAAFGNGNKSEIAKFAIDLYNNSKNKIFENKVFNINDFSEYDDMKITRSERTRAIVKIVDGCENHCSYCIIPSVRGKIRSRNQDSIIEEIKNLVASGYKEIVLTGIETAAYGKDGKTCSFPELLQLVDNIPGIERIRLGSLEPTVLKDDFIWALLNSQHIVPHLHLSLQSGSDRVLASMKRKYNTKMFYDAITKLRDYIPVITFTTDIIVGFPGETDEMFFETCEFVKKCEFLYVHIFPYSIRQGTVAATMQNHVSPSVKKLRAKKLQEIMLETRKEVFNSFDGVTSEVLFEEISNGHYIGHTEHFIPVILCGRTFSDYTSKIANCTLIYDENQSEYMYCKLL